MHAKNTTRYFLVVIAFIFFCFFTNDFNLINVQSTAIVTAIAIDRQEDAFSITAQVAIPSAKSNEGSGQGGASGGSSGSNSFATVGGTGGTIAQAIDQINQKTGWYPKLIFCRLLILGETLTSDNVFDALDYFLLNEYVADDCLLCAYEGKASEVLSAKTPMGSTPSLSLEKLFSSQAERVGATLPVTLREFADGYFSAGKSGIMPIVKKQAENDGEVFDAGETALFANGKMIGKLSKEETFCITCVKTPLRLAPYTVMHKQIPCTLTVKHNRRSTKFSVDGNVPKLRVDLSLYASVAHVATSQPPENLADGGDLPNGLLSVASERLASQILQTFEKCKALNFDVFDAVGLLQKYENAHFEELKDNLSQRLQLVLHVQFAPVR